MNTHKIIFRILKKLFRNIISVLGVIMLIFIILSFTHYPYYAFHYLGTADAKLASEPDYIIVMGAGGMPSAKGVLRCYYAAYAAHRFPDAMLVVALPADSAGFESSGHQLMIDELLERGIPENRVISEFEGSNTFTQARNIRKMITEDDAKLLIITSPDHMYRAIRTFRKQGFPHTGGMATFEHALDEALLLEKYKDGKSSRHARKMLGVRYNMWGYMTYQIVVLREYLAIAYYKIRGYM